MTEKMDHAAEAERIMNHDLCGPDDIAVVQFHATLALVDQQREAAISLGALVVLMTQANYNSAALCEQVKRVADALEGIAHQDMDGDVYVRVDTVKP